MITPWHIAALKGLLAVLGTLVLAWEAWSRTHRDSPRARLWRHRALKALGILAFLGWWNFGYFHFSAYVQLHEFPHYFLGAKYHSELGYTRLYHCTAVADAEQGLAADVSARWVRDLATNKLTKGADLLSRASECTTHFTPERWRAFSEDVRWFRTNVSTQKWKAIHVDHGYNATPVWTMTGRVLANLAPASGPFLFVLALIDPALLGLMWWLVWRTFGWATLCAALLWWGTDFPGRFQWVGGAFLRADWLLAMVASVCLMKRGRPLLSGFALGYSALLRVFPAIMAVGLGLREVGTWWSERRIRLSREAIGFCAGLALSVVTLVPAASLLNAGQVFDVSDWASFYENSRKYVGTAAMNVMGLKTVVAFDPASRSTVVGDTWLDSPWDTWKEARSLTFEERKGVFWAAVGLFTGVLALAVFRAEPWLALCLGAGLIPMSGELACYYYAFLLIYGLALSPLPWVPVLLVALSAVTNVAPVVWKQTDDQFTAISAALVAFVVAATAVAWRGLSQRVRHARADVG